ncbi:hypothetical protein BDD12DRAFT_830108 [Trichophaea hybrida]|nr:hypothetical protein BDD12DRAFT_830108 [Trichophaea hybrida]
MARQGDGTLSYGKIQYVPPDPSNITEHVNSRLIRLTARSQHNTKATTRVSCRTFTSERSSCIVVSIVRDISIYSSLFAFGIDSMFNFFHLGSLRMSGTFFGGGSQTYQLLCSPPPIEVWSIYRQIERNQVWTCWVLFREPKGTIVAKTVPR